MSVARMTCGALLCAPLWGLGCGERAGDPVIQLLPDQQTDTSPSQAGAAGASSVVGGVAGGVAGSVAKGEPNLGGASDGPGPIGLCGACSRGSDCGDGNDACIQYPAGRFCGRDCDDQHRCPDGYSCTELANQIWQCVPDTGCPQPRTDTPTLVDIRADVLSRINAERALRDQPPLAASGCLDELAQSSALLFASTDNAGGKFVKECAPVWPSCACGWTAEAEATIASYGLDWTTAVEHTLTPSRDAGNERFTTGYLDFPGTEVGIGFWLSGDEAWIALSLR